MKIIVGLTVLALVCIGCAPYGGWTKTNFSESVFNKDLAACNQEAEMTAPAKLTSVEATQQGLTQEETNAQHERRQLFIYEAVNSCMEARGYRQP